MACAGDLNTWGVIFECVEQGAFQQDAMVAAIFLFIVFGTILARTRMPAEVILAAGVGVSITLGFTYGGAFVGLAYATILVLAFVIITGLIRFAKK